MVLEDENHTLHACIVQSIASELVQFGSMNVKAEVV